MSCDFEVMVDACFAKAGVADGTQFTTVKGCTFKAYSTVQAALDATKKKGGTIKIAPGIYDENVQA